MSTPKAIRAAEAILAGALLVQAPHMASGQDDIERGASLVESRCLTCHKAGPMRDLVERCAAPGEAARLDALLKAHFSLELDDRLRADVIAYLTCDPAQQPKG